MEKKVLNIVITGGPCGGKTTVLNELSNLLRGYGYTVYIVNETATELINDGVRPFGEHKLDLVDFQSLLLDAQMAKEDIRRDAALLCDNPNVAILYDRGILDNRSYITEEIFDKFLRDRGLTEAEIITRYDMIIHLVTAAIGKEEYYTTLNNSARTETIEEARMQDGRTLDSWKCHPNLIIVGNDTLFDEKVLRVKNVVRNYIGEEEIVKQERYLVELNDIDFSFTSSMIKEEIEEFVLVYGVTEDELYSKSTIKGSSYYMRSINKYHDNTTVSIGRRIREKDFLHARSLFSGRLMKKIRYNFIDNNERFRLDIYDLGTSKFAILERDVVKNGQMRLPSFIHHAVEVSSNRDYNDDSICIDYNIQKIFKKH